MKSFFTLLLGIFLLSLSGCGRPVEQVVADLPEFVFTDTIIHEDMTWSGNVTIRGVFVVGRGATLRIEPGTIVRFQKVDTNHDGIGDSEIRVLGRILAEGTGDRPVTFKSAEEYPVPRDWSYVLIFASGEKNFLRYCRFSDAFTGLQVHFSTAEVSDSVFTGNNEGIRFGRAKIKIAHNRIEDNNLGIRFTRMEGPAEITGNVITDNRIGIFLVPSGQNIVDFFDPGRTGKPWNEGHLLITGNNIFGNRDYDLNLGAKQKWDLAIGGNWWGRADHRLIREKIFDHARDDALGHALIEPLRQEPVRDTGPR